MQHTQAALSFVDPNTSQLAQYHTLTHCYAMFLVNRHTQEAGSNLMLMSDCIAILLISTSQAEIAHVRHALEWWNQLSC